MMTKLSPNPVPPEQKMVEDYVCMSETVKKNVDL